jgi:hypothetical protein
MTIGISDSAPITDGRGAVVWPIDSQSKCASLRETSIHLFSARAPHAKVIDPVRDSLDW